MAVLVVLALILLEFSCTLEQVSITPLGPLYIPINTPTFINCSTNGTRFDVWRATFTDGSTREGISGELSPGIVITHFELSFSSIIVDTMTTSLVSLECFAETLSIPRVLLHEGINITIYDVPDPADNLSYTAYGDFVHTSWMLKTMERITVAYYLSLLFHEPSQIRGQRVNVSDVQSYNFSIYGLRSCDYFTFCVRGSNDAGQGNESCINGNLLYIPTKENIKYSLSRENENFSLTVTVKVPATCEVNVKNSSYVLEVMGENDSRKSESVSADSESYLQVNNLLANSSYMFRIESKNSNDSLFSMWIDFFTSDVQGVNICSTNKGLFSVSCVYANGSNLTGCRFNLTGSNIEEFGSKITKDNTITNIPNFMKYENITILDINGEVLFERDFKYQDIPRCSSTTVPSNSSTAPTTDMSEAKSGTSTAIIVVIVVILGTALLLLGATICFVIYLHRNGYCLHKMNFVPKEVPIDGRQIESNTQKLNGKSMTSDKTQDTEVNTAGMYSSLDRLHTPHGTDMKKLPEAEYSQLKQEPLYHVLEKEPPLVSEDISADPDAPAVPPFCPSGGDTPPVAEVQQTTSTTTDLMYAEITNIRAKK